VRQLLAVSARLQQFDESGLDGLRRSAEREPETGEVFVAQGLRSDGLTGPQFVEHAQVFAKLGIHSCRIVRRCIPIRFRSVQRGLGAGGYELADGCTASVRERDDLIRRGSGPGCPLERSESSSAHPGGVRQLPARKPLTFTELAEADREVALGRKLGEVTDHASVFDRCRRT
jgi:hypothetical protein